MPIVTTTWTPPSAGSDPSPKKRRRDRERARPARHYCMPKLHVGQQAILDDPARFKVLTTGRQWGKTKLASAIAVKAAFDGQCGWVVAPTYKLARPIWRQMMRLARQIPGAHINKTERLVEFESGGWVEVRSASDPDSLRGETLDFLIMDEAAFAAESAWTESLRATLTVKRGWAIFISTPKGRNWFWRLWVNGQRAEGDPEYDPEWRSWRMPTEANPYQDPAEVAKARRQVSDREARQEFDAEFLEDGGEVFRNVRKLSTLAELTREDLEAVRKADQAAGRHRTFVLGLDLARKSDYTALSVIDITDGYDGTAVEVYAARFNQVAWATQVRRIEAVIRRFGIRRVIVDANGVGDPVVERLREALRSVEIEEFSFDYQSRIHLLDNLALRFDQETIRCLYDETAISELEAFEVGATKGGKVRYEVPEKMHDDTVMAKGLALWALHEAEYVWEVIT